MTYWLDLFTAKTWQEFLDHGASISGFREGRWKTVQKIKPGDRLLCYITGISRFIGILEVTSEAFQDKSKIWADAEFPCRLKVKPIVTLALDTAIPVTSMRDQLSIFKNLKSPTAWSGSFRGSPARWKSEDGDAILKALLNAQTNPVVRPVDERKLNYRPNILKTKLGAVTIPEPETTLPVDTKSTSTSQQTNESSIHDRMQFSLAKLGCDLGLDVWVARNDRNRTVDGFKISDLPRMLDALPIHFDLATKKTIELIDVLSISKAPTMALPFSQSTSINSMVFFVAGSK
jgi:predicted RNA-binding protein